MGIRDGEGLIGADSTEPDSNLASPPPSLAIAQTDALHEFSRGETSVLNQPSALHGGRHQPTDFSSPSREDTARGPVMHTGPLQHDPSMIPDESKRDAIIQKAPGTSPETTGYAGVMSEERESVFGL